MVIFKKKEDDIEELKLDACTVSASFGKDVISRNIAQADTILTYWGRRNITFTIQGVLYEQLGVSNLRIDNPINKAMKAVGYKINKKTKKVDADLQKLIAFCNYTGALFVSANNLIDKYWVGTVVITDLQTPFTAGQNKQNYTITCISDSTLKPDYVRTL